MPAVGIAARSPVAVRSARRRGIALISAVLAANIVLWGITFAIFNRVPTLIGIALVVYGLGLRHAVDVDHIAAIDNVTRKLMLSDKKPVSVGFWFAIGHSFIVVLVTAAVTGLTENSAIFSHYREIAGSVTTAFSAIFFIVIAGANIDLAARILACKRRLASGEVDLKASDLSFQPKGLFARLLGPLLRTVNRPGHMFLVGFVFGLSFDTASEVALIGTTGAQLAAGASYGAVLLLPLLFTAGMALVDTMDGVFMLRIYDWAVRSAERTLNYNLVITVISAIISTVIAVVAGSELLNAAVRTESDLSIAFNWVGDNSAGLGCLLLFSFASCFALSWLRGRRGVRSSALQTGLQ